MLSATPLRGSRAALRLRSLAVDASSAGPPSSPAPSWHRTRGVYNWRQVHTATCGWSDGRFGPDRAHHGAAARRRTALPHAYLRSRSHANDSNGHDRTFSAEGGEPTPTTTSTTTTTTLSGEECYQRAMDAMRKSERSKSDEEESRAAEQFDAMARSDERQGARDAAASAEASRRKDSDEGKAADGSGGDIARNRAAGVAVVRTIARQTRRERDARFRKQDQATRRQLPADAGRGGGGGGRDDCGAEALEWLRRAAYDHGHPQALVRLGNEALEEAKTQRSSSVDGAGATKDQASGDCRGFELDESALDLLSPIERAVRLYGMAGERGSSEGYFNLGHLLWTGFLSESDGDTALTVDDDARYVLLPDRTAALGAFKVAIKHGDVDAMFFVGVQYLSDDDEWAATGCGDEEDDAPDRRRRGLELVHAAAGLGHGGALHYLALFHRNGDSELGVGPCAAEEFADRLDRAADSGDADSLFLRAHCAYHGEDGYDQNYAAALDDFLRSAEGGNVDAAISAGAMLHRGGFGGAVTRDRRRAFELYQEAAEMGSLEGWRNLVSCYALGEGVPKCEKTAKYIAETMLRGS